MQEIKKIEDVECMREDCEKPAVSRIKTSGGAPLELCVRHQEKFAEKIKEKIAGKYEGMSEEEIAQKMVAEGESLFDVE